MWTEIVLGRQKKGQAPLKTGKEVLEISGYLNVDRYLWQSWKFFFGWPEAINAEGDHLSDL